MKCVSSLSGGVASAVATDRGIKRYGKENIHLWFADPNFEDEDLYRFLDDLESYWGKEIMRFRTKDNPLTIAEKKKIIPNSLIAPCSEELKIKPFTKFIKEYKKPVVVLLGLDWSEQHRMKAPTFYYEKIEGAKVEYPLMWKPYNFDIFQEVRSWGIEIPKLYKMGFAHNNCGGRCFRQGIKEWQRLLINIPQRFTQMRDWEDTQRMSNDARKNRTICTDQSTKPRKSLTLAEIEKREIENISYGQEDLFSCFCSY